MIRNLVALSVLSVLSACALPREPADRLAMLARGHDIAQTHCAVCHAIERTGESPAPEAPPFRTLSSRNFRVSTLEDALAKGVSIGHPAMPEFQFRPDDTHALVSYLQAIQDDRAAQSNTHR